MRFIFTNGKTEKVTDIFGISNDPNGKLTTHQIFNVTEAITSVSHLMVNTQLSQTSPVNSGWYMVNFELNNK